MLRILTGGAHSSATQRKTVRALDMFKILTGGVHPSVFFLFNEPVRDRGSTIQRPRMGTPATTSIGRRRGSGDGEVDGRLT